MTTMIRYNKSGGLLRHLVRVAGKAILPAWMCLLAFGLITCSDPATIEETPDPELPVPGLIVTELVASDELQDYERRFTVRLNTAPTENVDVTPSASGVIFTPTPIRFTSANYATAQEVIVTNVGNTSTNLTITLNISSDDTAYDSLVDVALSGTVSLTQGPGLIVSELVASDELQDYERRFTVRLNTAPTENVDVTPSAEGVTFTPPSLVFTSANWNSPQEVIVTNVGIMGTSLTIILITSSTDTIYNVIADVVLRGTISPAPVPGLIISPISAGFELRLTRAPTANVTVELSSNKMDVSFDPSSPLTFTSTNWETAQAVGLTLPDPVPDDLRITLSSTSTTDTAYNLTQVVSGNLSPLPINYSLHVHNARTPEPERENTRPLEVWFTLHPTNSVVPTALSDITITYTVGGGDATGGTSAAADYMSSATGTVVLLQGTSMINITIPILKDTTSSTTDTGDETFTVTITSATAGVGESVSIADDSATVTIGEPKSDAIYFFPNRPLAEGDASLLRVLCRTWNGNVCNRKCPSCY